MRSRHGRQRSVIAVLAVLAVVAAACGGDDTLDGPTDAQLVLDFVPGGIHAGIFAGVCEGYWEDENVNIDIQSPTSSADTLRLVLSGQSTFGIAPIADVAQLRADGEPIQVFMALEQVPLAALMSTEAIGITDPSQLTGGIVGVTGVPSDEAVANVILESSGVDTSTVDFVTIGFDAVGNLIGQSVDAAIGFWSAEAVVLELEGEVPIVFRPDEYGAPPYPELVIFAATDTIEENGALVQAFYNAMASGYEYALGNQDGAISCLAEQADGVDVDFANAEFDNVEPHFLGPNDVFGEISDEAISDYLEWATSVEVLTEVPEDFITTQFLP